MKPPFQVLEIVVFRRSLIYTLGFVGLLWLIKAVEWAGHVRFTTYGILPQTLEGTLGIVFGPLIHSDAEHLLSNTFPLITLGIGLFFLHYKVAKPVMVFLYLATGFFVWLLGQGNAYHVGASGIVYGMVSFLFFMGVFRKDIPSLAISLIIIFLYNGMVLGIFPSDEPISWESHMAGAVLGFGCALYCRKVVSWPPIEIDIDETDFELEERLLQQQAQALPYANGAMPQQYAQGATPQTNTTAPATPKSDPANTTTFNQNGVTYKYHFVPGGPGTSKDSTNKNEADPS